MPPTIEFLFRHWFAVNGLIIIVFIGVSIALHYLVKNKEANALYVKRANPSEYDPPADFSPAFLASVPGGVNVGHIMGATIVDLTQRGYLKAQNDANGVRFTKVLGVDVSSLFSFEIDLLRGMFYKNEIFYIADDVGGAFDWAYEFGFSKHEQEQYLRRMRERNGGQELNAQLNMIGRVLIFAIMAGFFVTIILWFFFPASFVAGITTPYIIFQTYTIILSRKSPVYREYIERETILKAYRDYLRTASPFFDQSSDILKWDKHTAYRVAFGLHTYWSPVFKKDAFLNPQIFDRS